MDNTKKQRGITLIALIITIIVMLILVGVTITMAVDGGIFSKASEAAKQMEDDTIYETIISEMDIEKNGNIKIIDTFEAAKKAIEKQYGDGCITEKVNSSEKITFEVKGKNEKYTYTITNKQIVKGEIEDETEPPGDETNPWKLETRSMTSDNVQYDVLYKCENKNNLNPDATSILYDFGAVAYSDGSCGFVIQTLNLYSGDKEIDFDALNKNINNKNYAWNNHEGDEYILYTGGGAAGYVSKEECDTYISGNYMKVGTNWLSFPVGSTEYYITIVFDSANTAKLYVTKTLTTNDNFSSLTGGNTLEIYQTN